MGRTRVNIYEVADRAEVSIATVSRVRRGIGSVAPGTRDRVLEAMETLKFRPSPAGSALAGRRHGALGIVFPSLSGPYYSEVIRGYEERVVGEGESLLILGTYDRGNCEELVRELADRVDGMTIMGRTVSDDLVQELDEEEMPLSLLARPMVGQVPTVRAETISSATHLTQHLLSKGHRHIGFVGAPELSPDAADRWRGFIVAHQEAGLEPPESPISSTYLQEDGYRAALSVLVGRQRPTALMCANDEIALGVYEAARELYIKIPDQLAVVGWDDIPVARFLSPALTTVRQPMRELGEQAAHLLLRRIKEDSRPSESVSLPTEPILRESC